MPDGMTAKAAAEEDSELKLLEEVVRQGEVRLAALTQARQMVAAKATTAMTWLLTVFLALTAALASIRVTGSFTQAKEPLLLIWFCAILGTTGSMAAVLGNLWPERLGTGQPWHHPGSNPRHFLPIPAAKPIRPVANYLRKRFKVGKSSPTPEVAATTLPSTKKDALLDTATRYAQAIEENERSLAMTSMMIAASLAAITIPVAVVLAFPRQLPDFQFLERPTPTTPTAPPAAQPNPAPPDTPAAELP